MLDPSDYRKAIRRNNARPETYRIRRHSVGLGFAAFWIVYLAAMAYGLARLYGYVVHRIP